MNFFINTFVFDNLLELLMYSQPKLNYYIQANCD